MGVMVTVLVHMPELWIFAASLVVSGAALAVFLWWMEKSVARRAPQGPSSRDKAPDEENALLAQWGYDYDARQDVLVSRFDAWQRRYGYCRLQDEAAAACGALIHCEPVPFTFRGRRYLLGFWKGQYGLAAGAEIGLLRAEGPDLFLPGVFQGPLYRFVPDEECPAMTLTLFKGEKVLFGLEARHWRLAGFRPGLFARAEDLVLRASLTFPSQEMAQAVYSALLDAGYTPYEIGRVDETVYVTFSQPHTPQPRSQKGHLARLRALRLWWAARRYRRAVRNLPGIGAVLERLKEKRPALFAMLSGGLRGLRLLTARGALPEESLTGVK